ncbi:RidA family protein [Demequina sediminicola]|uniref:RidA family protein n=1 Tax=Demequina sediminicola TaxID=1095026 RepID=UPI0007826D95|nr:RidA family protein [Demequina sediminicola]
MTASARLAELGITLPNVATPVGAYVPALSHGDLVYTSGQLPMVDGSLVATGLVGDGAGQVSPSRAAECAEIAILNALAAVADVAGGIDQITQIVKITGFVAAPATFTGHPAIINGASNLIGEIFGDRGQHVRSAVGVASLPLGAPVEIELVAQVHQA